MSDRVQFNIQTTLNKPSNQDIDKVKKEIENQIKTININTTTNGKGIKLLDTKEIDIYKKHMENMMQNLRTRYGKLLDSNDIRKQVNEFNSALSGFGKNGLDKKDIGLQFETLTTNVKSASGAIRIATQDADTLGNVLMKDVQKFGLWFGIGTLFMSVVHSIQGMITTVYDLDTALINLKKVTDETDDSYRSFLRTSNETAKSLAVSTVQVIDAATAWVKAGYTLSQAQELAKSTLIGSNVGDISVDEMQSFLVAPLKAYNMEAKDSIDLVSKMNNISNKHAITIQDLGQAYNRASSVMALANNSIDEFTALVTAAQAQTQMGGDVIGNAFRTIALRIISMKDEEGKAIPQMEDDLKRFGVALKDVDGNLLSTYDIVRQLNDAFSTNMFSREEQLALLEKLAGKRQVNILAAAIDNFSEAQKALDDSINAGSSALDEQAKYLESIEAKVKQFKETTVGMWNNFLSSDVIKFTVDFGTALVTLVDKIGVLATSMSGLLIYLGAVGKLNMITMFNGLSIALGRFTLAMTGSAAAASFMASAFSILAPVAIVAGIVGMVKVFDALTVSLEEQREIVTKLNSELANLQTEYDKLKGNENRTTEQEQYLKLLEQEINDKKELQKIETQRALEKEFLNTSDSKYKNDAGIDDSGSGRIKSSINELIQLEGQLANATSKKAYDEINEKILKIRISLEGSGKSIQDYINQYKELGLEIPPFLIELSNSINDVIVKNNEIVDSTNDATKANQDNKTSYEELNKTFEESTNKLIDYNDMIQELQKNHKLSAENVNKIFKDYPQLLAYLGDEKTLHEKLIELKDQEAKKQRDAYIEMIQDSEDFYNLRIKGNTELTNEIKDKYDIDLKNFKTLAQAKEKIESTLLNSLSSKWGTYFDATRNALTYDYTELQRVNPEMAKQIYGDVVKYFRTGNEFNDIIGKFVSSDFDALNLSKTSNGSNKTKDLEAPYKSFYQTIKDLNFELNKQQEILNQTEDSDQIPILTKRNELLKDQQNNLHILNNARREEFDALGKISNRTDEQEERYQELSDKIQETSLEWWRLSSAIHDNNEAMKQINKTAKELTEKTFEDQKKSLEDLLKTSIEYEKKVAEQQLETQLKLHQDLIDSYELQNDALQDKIDKLEEEADLEDEIYETQRKKDEIAKARQRLNNALKEKNVQIFNGTTWEWISDPREVKEAQDNLNDLQEDFNKYQRGLDLKYRRQSLQDQIESNKKKIDAEKKLMDSLENVFDTAWQDINMIFEQRLQDLNITQSTNMAMLINNMKIYVEELKAEFAKLANISYNPDKNPTKATKENGYTKDYNAMYNEAREKGDWQGMEEANRQANIERGKGNVVTAQADIDYIKKKYSNYGGGSAGEHSAYATGTDGTDNELALIGEKGAELAWFNKGTKILPSDLSKQLLELPRNINNLINMQLPKLQLPSSTNSLQPVVENHYHFDDMTVKTNDARSFMNQLKRQVRS